MSCGPGGNWIALKGLICEKPPFAHHNQSPDYDAYLYSPECISHRCSLFIFSFMPMTSWFVWQLTDVIERSVKYSSGKCQLLSRFIRIERRALWEWGRFLGIKRCFSSIQMHTQLPVWVHQQTENQCYMVSGFGCIGNQAAYSHSQFLYEK